MKTQITQGSWQVEIIGMGQDEHVCNIVAGPAQVAEGVFFSDARLIAAAPDLLAALEQIAEMTNGATGGMHVEIYEIAAATLAKARG